ncbi:MAG: RNA 2'-phosphotransferase [Bacteroidota bacterium]
MSNQKTKTIVKTSKLFSLILRHQPDVIGIELDENGWADIKELIGKFSKKYFPINRSIMDEVVANNNKKRFSYDDSGTKIRANQGHSIAVDVELEEKTPPHVLYHGTVEKFLHLIFESGLLKMSRQHVHLSADIDTAKNVGSRRGKPVILTVDSQQAFADGIKFYLSKNGVWLADHIPTKYLQRI